MNTALTQYCIPFVHLHNPSKQLDNTDERSEELIPTVESKGFWITPPKSTVHEVPNFLNLLINNKWNTVKEISLFKYFNIYSWRNLDFWAVLCKQTWFHKLPTRWIWNPADNVAVGSRTQISTLHARYKAISEGVFFSLALTFIDTFAPFNICVYNSIDNLIDSSLT